MFGSILSNYQYSVCPVPLSNCSNGVLYSISTKQTETFDNGCRPIKRTEPDWCSNHHIEPCVLKGKVYIWKSLIKINVNKKTYLVISTAAFYSIKHFENHFTTEAIILYVVMYVNETKRWLYLQV